MVFILFYFQWGQHLLIARCIWKTLTDIENNWNILNCAFFELGRYFCPSFVSTRAPRFLLEIVSTSSVVLCQPHHTRYIRSSHFLTCMYRKSFGLTVRKFSQHVFACVGIMINILALQKCSRPPLFHSFQIHGRHPYTVVRNIWKSSTFRPGCEQHVCQDHAARCSEHFGT